MPSVEAWGCLAEGPSNSGQGGSILLVRTVRIQLHPGASPWREALRGGGRSGCQFVGLFAVTRGKSKLWSLQKPPVETESLSAVPVYWRISSVFWPAQSRMDPSSHVPFVDRLAQRSAQMQVSVIQLSSSYTRPPRNQFLLQSSNGWAACSGFCRTRRTIERDQCFGALARAVGKRRWCQEGGSSGSNGCPGRLSGRGC